jgi:hypothetical protein
MLRMSLLIPIWLGLFVNSCAAHNVRGVTKTVRGRDIVQKMRANNCDRQKQMCLSAHGPTLPRHPDVLNECFRQYDECIELRSLPRR